MKDRIKVKNIHKDKQVSSRMIRELPRSIVLKEVLLNNGINCILGNPQLCKNARKCNRKNNCNESLKPFF
jgi:hypothetical protein